MCEHCGQKLEPGKLRTAPGKSGLQAKDDTRHCGFCKFNFACCMQGLHGEVSDA
jgi:hypothetical protein